MRAVGIPDAADIGERLETIEGDAALGESLRHGKTRGARTDDTVTLHSHLPFPLSRSAPRTCLPPCGARPKHQRPARFNPLASRSSLIDLCQFTPGAKPAQCHHRALTQTLDLPALCFMVCRPGVGGSYGYQARRHHKDLGRHLDLPSQGDRDPRKRRGHRRDHGRRGALSLAGPPCGLDAFHRAHERRRRRHHGRHEGDEPHPPFHRRHGHGRGRRNPYRAGKCAEGPRATALRHHRDRQCHPGRHGDRRDQGLILSRRLRPSQLLRDRRSPRHARRQASRDHRARQSRRRCRSSARATGCLASFTR